MSEKQWKTASGVVVVQKGPRMPFRTRRGRLEYKINTFKLTGGYHGLLWLKNLTPVKP